MIAAVFLTLLPPPAAHAQAPGTGRRLAGEVPVGAIAAARPLGPLPPTTPLTLVLALPLRNQPALNTLLQSLYDPHNVQHGHYLTPAQFTAQFGPTQADYDAVTTYARSVGLAVTGTHPNRLLLDVTGPASAVEAAFSLHLNQFTAPDGRVFYAPDADPAVPDAIADRLTGIVGLDNAAVAQPQVRLSKSAPVLGLGPATGLTPAEIKSVYGLSGISLDGTGQTLGLFELDGYTLKDIVEYEAGYLFVPPPVNTTLQNILLDNFDGTPSFSDGSIEVTLDIELQLALAPKASKILIYEAPNSNAGVVDAYNKIATDDLATSISSSWGIPEDYVNATVSMTEHATFQEMAAQGQSIYIASGDSGAFADGATVSIQDPSGQPFVTAVGGTSLASTLNGLTDLYESETTWDIFDFSATINGQGGGGGISTLWPIPSYQVGAVSAASLGSTTKRNVPDVSLDADPNTGYSIYWEYYWIEAGGTSCAAPLWAGFTALVNQERALHSQPTLGFANPAIYAIGAGPNYNADFHDIKDGSTNGILGITGLGGFPAVTGFDDATGWGTFRGANLLADLAGVPVSSISAPNPPTGLTATGGNRQVTLSWTASPGAASYNVSRGTTSGGEALTPVATGVTGTTYTDTNPSTGLAPDTTYFYTVSAVSAAGASGASNEASALTAPAAPASLAAVAGNATVALSWTAAPGATGYNVYRGTATGAESATPLTTGVTGTTYADTTAANGVTYYYTVRATNSGGPGASSNEATAAPTAPPAAGAPTGLTATAGNGHVYLSWAPVSGATGYNVYHSLINGSGYTRVNTAPVTTASDTDTGVTNGSTYYYVVTALSSGGESGHSNQAIATPSASALPGITLPAGKDFFSTPYDLSSIPLSTLFGAARATVYTWHAGYVPVVALHRGIGYWVTLTQPVTLPATTVPTDTSFSIPLVPGWNAIGDPYPATIAVGELQVSSGGSTAPLTQATGVALPGVYTYSSATGQYTPVASLQAGQGYWVFADKAATLLVPSH